MPKGGSRWFRVVKLAIWAAAIMLFFRLMGHIAGGNFRDFWLIIATASTMFITFLVCLLRRFQLPGDTAGKSSALPVHVAEPANAIAMSTMGNEVAMTDNQDNGTKILHINTGTSFHNTPGGMMNFGHVTVTQHFDTPQAAPATANAEQQNQTAEPAVADDVIDINGLVDFSATVKSPGVSRNTIDKILREKNIKPCRTEKNDRAIRNLYPGKEAKAAIHEYFDDKKK